MFGVEADIQGTGMRDGFTCGLGCPGPAAASSVFNQKLEWFGTARARVGIATGPVLSYVTGGFAYGNVKTSLTETVGPGVGVFATNQNKGGWTIGSGVEASLGGNWTGKIEYLYLNLGDRLDLFTLNGSPQALSTDIRENIFRVGLNYRVNGGGNYVTAAARKLGRLLSRRQRRRRHRARSQRARDPLPRHQRTVQPDAGRHHRRHPGRLQLAGGKLGVRSGSRHPGIQPAG